MNAGLRTVEAGLAAGGTHRDSGNTERNITPDWSFDQLSVPGREKRRGVNVEGGVRSAALLCCLQSLCTIFFSFLLRNIANRR